MKKTGLNKHKNEVASDFQKIFSFGFIRLHGYFFPNISNHRFTEEIRCESEDFLATLKSSSDNT